MAIPEIRYRRWPLHDREDPDRHRRRRKAATVFDYLKRLIADKPPRAFVYKDHGSLALLTIGTLMGNLVGGKLAIEGRLARIVYRSLYRMHLIAIHGGLRALALVPVGHVNKIFRPLRKLH